MVERDKVDFLVGEISSASGLAISQVATRAQKMFMQTGCNSDELRGKNCSRYMFHLEANNSMYVRTIGREMLRQNMVKGKRWMAFTADYAFGHDLFEKTKRFMDENGAIFISNDMVPTDATEFSSLILKVRQQRPDLVMSNLAGNSTTNFMKQYKEFNLPIPLAGADLNAVSIWGAGEGSFQGAWPIIWTHQVNAPSAKAFTERFTKRWGRPPDNQAVADYLAEDVLARQPAHIRRFLLRTSILRQLDASVCSALNPRVDCAQLLEQLDTEQLFLTPVASEQRTWRYHSLFADYLRNQLQHESPDDVARLHLAASGWYESQGRPVPAIDHAIEGGDFPHAMALLATHGEQFLEQGRMRLLSRWFSSVPAPLLEQHSHLMMVAIWAACFTRGPWVAMEMLERHEALGLKDASFQSNAMCIRPMLLAMQDHSEEALLLGRQAMDQLPTGSEFADITLLNAMAHNTSVCGQPREAQQLLDAARQQDRRNSTFHRMYSETTEGLLDLQQGRLRQASARFRLAVDATHAVNFHHTHGNAWAGVLYASIVYESNQIDQADHLLNVYLPLARDVGLPDHMILSHVMRSRIAFIHGDVDAAWLAITELEYLGNQRKLPRVVAAARLERARLLLLQGNAAASQDELVRADDPTLWQRAQGQRLLAHDIEYMGLARLRWEIAFGDATRCLHALEAELATAVAASRQRRVLSLQLLRAMALQRAGDLATAVAQVGSALQWACQEGFMRLVLDEGPALGLLVQRYQTLHESGQVRDPLMGDYLQRLLQAFGPLPSESEKAAAPQAGILEPLTRKEIRVLQLLVEGYSNSAMAEKLYVSDSTVRTHLRNINMKLGAHSRTQAVAIARKLGLI